LLATLYLFPHFGPAGEAVRRYWEPARPVSCLRTQAPLPAIVHHAGWWALSCASWRRNHRRHSE